MEKLFIVVVDDGSMREAVHERLKKTYRSAYLHRDAAILVADKAAVSKDVAQAAGIGDDGTTGAVFRLGDGYSGYTARDLWEWLRDHGDD